MKKTDNKTDYPPAISKLMRLVGALRGEDGCPWDKKQTPQSMSVYLLEETYELVDAIVSGNPNEIREELGDVLFHIFFIAHLFYEQEAFDIQDVAADITEKMTRRHPHVFGGKKVNTTEEVKKNWQKIKKKEKNHIEQDSLLDSVPPGMPALMRAFSMSERAARAGFDWDDIDGVKAKVEEEWSELNDARNGQDQNDIDLEFGDLLFTLVNFARFADIHPETALCRAINKFETRFKRMEQYLADEGKNPETASMAEMDLLWEKIKKEQ